MRMQQVTHVDGVEERYVPGVGATPPSGLPRRLTPRWSLHPRHAVDRIKYQIRSVVGTSSGPKPVPELAKVST